MDEHDGPKRQEIEHLGGELKLLAIVVALVVGDVGTAGSQPGEGDIGHAPRLANQLRGLPEVGRCLGDQGCLPEIRFVWDEKEQ